MSLPISTVNTKFYQLKNTYFTIGSGQEVVLVMGSCRTVPYMNHFNLWNEQNGNRFTINFIDPFSFNWNDRDQRVDYDQALLKLETDDRLLNMLKSVDIFIHEHYQNAGLFNVAKDDYHNKKNIYQFGLNPKIDICLPNFNDLFILAGDIVSFDLDIRKKAIQDYNVLGKLSEQTEKEIFDISQRNLNKFYEVCRKSDIPQMERVFKQKFPTTRMFWTSNHVSKHFTFAIFVELMMRLKMEMKGSFLEEILKEDMFANNYTYLTELDVKLHGFEWGEEIKSLRDRL